MGDLPSQSTEADTRIAIQPPQLDTSGPQAHSPPNREGAPANPYIGLTFTQLCKRFQLLSTSLEDLNEKESIVQELRRRNDEEG